MIPADLITLGQQAVVYAVINGLFWLAIKRGLDRETKERENLQKEVKDLGDRRIGNIEADLKSDGEKRKLIYERLEIIKLDWMSKKEHREAHAADAGQSENYMAAVLKLERVSTEVARLVGWVDDVSKEQISLGKDLAGLTSKVQTLSENQP